MTSSSGDSDLIRKKASFIQHSLPGLEPGRYQIQVEQSLLTSDGQDITEGGLPALTRKFGVSGPRFALSQSAIHSVFPPINSAGEFSNGFAHVVLETDKLPWLRSPYSPANEPQEQVLAYTTVVNHANVEVNYDSDRASWLGVMLVSPSDFDHADPSRLIVQGTVRDLIPASLTALNASGAAVPGTLPANAYSMFSYLLNRSTRANGRSRSIPASACRSRTRCSTSTFRAPSSTRSRRAWTI